MIVDCRAAGSEIDWNRLVSYDGTMDILVLDHLPDLHKLCDCPNITSIRIEGTGTSFQHFEFIGLECIRRLSINCLSLPSWKSLAKLECLLELTIADCNVKELSFLTTMLELRKFRLRYSRPVFVESVELNIVGLMAAGNLEELEFVLTPNICTPTILAVQYLPNIKRLALDGCGLSNASSVFLTNSGLFLEELSLERNSLSQIPDLNRLTHLREIWLGKNRIQRVNLHSLTPRETPLDIYLDQNPIQEVWNPPFCRVHMERDAKDPDIKTIDQSALCNVLENDFSDSNEWAQVLDHCANQFELHSARQTRSYIEESLVRGTQWAVFEPNDPRLWEQLRFCISRFMFKLYCKGALKGRCPNDAYYVACGRGSTMSQPEIESGAVRIEVGLALFNPGEFQIIRIEIGPT